MNIKLLLVLMALFFCLIPDSVFADSVSEECNAKAFDAMTGAEKGPEDCVVVDSLLSGTICIVQSVIAKSMFKVYCSIVAGWKPILSKTILIYMIFYGISIALGIGKHSMGDAAFRYIKVTVIWMLATKPEFFYFLMYETFMNALNGFAQVIVNASGGDSGESINSIFNSYDEIFNVMVGDRLLILVSIAYVLAITGIGLPLCFLIMMGVFAMLMAFFRLMISFTTSIMAITFLLMFTPIFVTFLLFSNTRTFFEKWLGSLIAFTLQPIFILAFIYVIATAVSPSKLIDSLVNEQFLIVIPPDEKAVYIFPSKSFPSWLTFTIKAPKFDPWPPSKKLDDGSIVPIEGGIFGVLKITFAYIICWIILNVTTSAFLVKLPELANKLSRFQGFTGAVVGGKSQTIASISGVASGASLLQGKGGESAFYTLGGSAAVADAVLSKLGAGGIRTADSVAKKVFRRRGGIPGSGKVAGFINKSGGLFKGFSDLNKNYIAKGGYFGKRKR